MKLVISLQDEPQERFYNIERIEYINGKIYILIKDSPTFNEFQLKDIELFNCVEK